MRRITITGAPFDYRWHHGAVTAFTENGTFPVKDEVAEYAIRKGYATDASSEEALKTSRPKRVRTSARGKASNAKRSARVGNTNPPRARRAANRPRVDSDAG